MAATDAHAIPIKNQAFRVYFPILDNDGDLVVGATIDSGLVSGSDKAMVSKDGATPVNSTNNVTEVGNAQSFGQYYLDLEQAEMNYDCVQITIRTTTADAKNTAIVLYPKDIGDIPVSLEDDAITAGKFDESTAYPIISADTSSTRIARTGADGDTLEILSDQIDGITPADPSAIADAVWDEVLTGATHNVPSSAGRRLRAITSNILLEGTASAGSLNTITIPDGNGTDDSYRGNRISIIGGTGAGQTSIIMAYDGTTKVATVDDDWEVTPGATSEYIIVVYSPPQATDYGVARAGTASTIQLRAGASILAGSYLNGNTVLITSGTGKKQARIITAYDQATQTVTVSPNWTRTPDNTSVYRILPSGSDPFCIADRVWDELKAEHTIADSFGDYLDVKVSSRLAPTTSGRTLDVTANGNAGIDWGNVENNGDIVTLANTSILNTLNVINPVLAQVVSLGASGDQANLSGISGDNFLTFFHNAGNATSKIVDDVGGGITSIDIADIADAVWDEARLDHLIPDTYGEQMDWMLHKDISRTFDRSTDSLEAIRDSMATGGAIPSLDAIADAVWDEIQSEHILAGTFGLYLDMPISEIDAHLDIIETKVDNIESIVNDIRNDLDIIENKIDNIESIVNNINNEIVTGAMWDELRLDHLVDGSFGEAVDWVLHKDTNRTFNRTTDSLEAISDTMLRATTIIDGTIDAQTILKRIHALMSGNGSTRIGDEYTFKNANGVNYIRQTITDAQVTTVLV